MKFLFSIRFFFTLLIPSILFSSCYIARSVYWNFAGISDYKKFQYLEVKKPDVPFTFKKSIKGLSFDTITYNHTLYKFDDFLDENRCVAFIIIRNDSILYEKYF